MNQRHAGLAAGKDGGGWLARRKSPRRAAMTLTLNPEAIDLAT